MTTTPTDLDTLLSDLEELHKSLAKLRDQLDAAIRVLHEINDRLSPRRPKEHPSPLFEAIATAAATPAVEREADHA